MLFDNFFHKITHLGVLLSTVIIAEFLGIKREASPVSAQVVSQQ